MRMTMCVLLILSLFCSCRTAPTGEERGSENEADAIVREHHQGTRLLAELQESGIHLYPTNGMTFRHGQGHGLDNMALLQSVNRSSTANGGFVITASGMLHVNVSKYERQELSGGISGRDKGYHVLGGFVRQVMKSDSGWYVWRILDMTEGVHMATVNHRVGCLSLSAHTSSDNADEILITWTFYGRSGLAMTGSSRPPP